MKDQLKGASSVEAYINAFKRGCKCVERKSVHKISGAMHHQYGGTSTSLHSIELSQHACFEWFKLIKSSSLSKFIIKIVDLTSELED